MRSSYGLHHRRRSGFVVPGQLAHDPPPRAEQPARDARAFVVVRGHAHRDAVDGYRISSVDRRGCADPIGVV